MRNDINASVRLSGVDLVALRALEKLNQIRVGFFVFLFCTLGPDFRLHLSFRAATLRVYRGTGRT